MLKKKLPEIIERLQKGEALSRICKDNDMPAVTSIYGWMKDDDCLLYTSDAADD